MGAGATWFSDATDASSSMFQSSPARGGGCNEQHTSASNAFIGFQSSPARGGGCNSVPDITVSCCHADSILTRPWGRVQRFMWSVSMPITAVSILTRPWGRVQLTRAIGGRVGCRLSFNPHPPVGAGATMRFVRSRHLVAPVFQSSPARGGGCNGAVPSPRGGRRSGFNPHPPVGAGATT